MLNIHPWLTNYLIKQPKINQPCKNQTMSYVKKRTRVQPKYLGDFNVNLPPSIDHARPTFDQVSSTVHSVANYLSYDKFSNSHKSFLAAITINDEPKTFSQSMHDENWKYAMKREIQALEQKLSRTTGRKTCYRLEMGLQNII